MNRRAALADPRNVSMTARWRAAPVQGAWRIEIADFQGHRLRVRRVTPTGLYRVYLNGRPLGCWRGRDTAMAAAEWAALLRNAPSPARTGVRGLRRRVIGGTIASLESRAAG